MADISCENGMCRWRCIPFFVQRYDPPFTLKIVAAVLAAIVNDVILLAP